MPTLSRRQILAAMTAVTVRPLARAADDASLLDIFVARLSLRHPLSEEARDLLRAKLANGDCLIHLWNPRTGQSLTGSAPRSGAKTRIAVSPNGSALASTRCQSPHRLAAELQRP